MVTQVLLWEEVGLFDASSLGWLTWMFGAGEVMVSFPRTGHFSSQPKDVVAVA